MMAFLSRVLGVITSKASAIVGGLVAIASAALWIFARGKESQKAKQLEHTSKVNAGKQERLNAAIEAARREQEKGIRIANQPDDPGTDADPDRLREQIDEWTRGDPHRRD